MKRRVLVIGINRDEAFDFAKKHAVGYGMDLKVILKHTRYNRKFSSDNVDIEYMSVGSRNVDGLRYDSFILTDGLLRKGTMKEILFALEIGRGSIAKSNRSIENQPSKV